MFKRYGVDSVYICFDADKHGKQATASVSARLQAEGIRTHCVSLAEGCDINDFFSSFGGSSTSTAKAADHFRDLLHQANPRGSADEIKKDEPIRQEAGQEDQTQQVIQTDYGFVMTAGGRKYEVRGILKNDSKLKATVKGIVHNKSKRRLHVDTVDFYSARSRTYLIKGLCDLFDEEEHIF